MENNSNIIEKQEELKSEIQRSTVVQIDVVNQVTFDQANNRIAELQTMKKNVEARFADPKKKAKEAHAAICALEKEFLTPVQEAIDSLKGKTTSWYAAEQQRIAAEEERRRIAAEEMANMAVEAETAGDSATAAEAVAVAAVEASCVSYVPKTKGTTMRESWKAVVTDPDKVPREYLIVNEKALDALAKATKGSMKIPGVEFRKEFINATAAR